MATVIRPHVTRLVHASVKQRSWTMPSLSAALLAVMVLVVVLLAWESTIDVRTSTTAVDVEFGDEPSGTTTIVDDSPFGLPLRPVVEQATATAAPGMLAADRTQPAHSTPVDRPLPRTQAPPSGGTGGGTTGRRSTAPSPTRPAPNRPAPTRPAPEGGTTAGPVAVPPATAAPTTGTPLPDPGPAPAPVPVAPAPTVDVPPLVSVGDGPSVGVGPVAGVSAGVDSSGVQATAPVVGSVSVSAG